MGSPITFEKKTIIIIIIKSQITTNKILKSFLINVYKIPRHQIRDCKKWITKEANKTNQNQINILKTEDHLFTIVCAFTNNIVEQNVWYVDLRATQHLTPQRDWFRGYIPFLTQEMVYISDNTFHKVEGPGSVGIKFLGGMIKYLQKILHVHGLCKNLI